LIDNLPRVLPKDCDAVIDTQSWRVPVIFEFLQHHGKVDRTEMFQVFNMGIGMAVVVAAKNAAGAISLLKAKPIGRIERGRGQTRLVF
jgi:phosphoribosylformylglycinamidine cyclo-ligase